MEKLKIGLLGFGSIGKVHTLCYHEIPQFYPSALPPLELTAVCTSNEESAAKAREEGKFKNAYSDIDAMLEDSSINVIDCCLPNYLRLEAIKKILAKNKHIYCEKPLANTGLEAQAIYDMVQQTDSKFGLTFNFRFIPAVLRAKELIDSGDLGEVFHYNIKYYHTGYQNPNRPMSWRLEKSKSGGGAIVDMGAHIIDLMRFLVGDYESVQATMKTWITKRALSKGSSEYGNVDVDDAAWLTVAMKNGAVGSIETSRFATGTLDDLVFEIFASKGAVRFHLMDANWLYYFDERSPSGSRGGRRGWTRLETVQSYPGSSTPPPRSILGWTRTHAENQYQFLQSIVNDTVPSPSIKDGLAVQYVIDAAFQSADNKSTKIQVQD